MRWQGTGFRAEWKPFLVAVAILVSLGCLLYPLDMSLAVFLQKIGDLPGDVRRILALSELLAHGTGVAVILAIAWCLAPHQRLHLPRIAACAFVAGVVATSLKMIHARIRPLTCPPEIDQVAATWKGWWPSLNQDSIPFDYAMQSFPSAHTATAVGFAVGLTWLYPRGKYVFYALATFAGLQRIVFLAHWPSDVVFGAAIGVLLGGCFVLPGTLGNYIFNRLEWRMGLGRELQGLGALQHGLDDQSKRAA